jgi:hypothetical protein
MENENISINELGYLIGQWDGNGLAEFPTIKSFDYHESLIFNRNNKNLLFHYEQRALIKSSDARNNEPISWESGFLIDKENGLFEMVCSHNTGRVEILKGFAIRLTGQKIKLELESVSTINDDRIIRTTRVFIFSEIKIEYELKMSTTKNFSFQRHLSATLFKV